MASAAVMAAVEAYVAAHWTATPIRGLNGGGSVPLRNTAFLSIEYLIADEEQLTFGSPGSNVFRETGAFRIVLSIPAGAGLGGWPARLDVLRAALRSRSFGGLVTEAVPPSFLDNRSDRGAYFELHIAVPYRFDALG